MILSALALGFRCSRFLMFSPNVIDILYGSVCVVDVPHVLKILLLFLMFDMILCVLFLDFLHVLYTIVLVLSSK